MIRLVQEKAQLRRMQGERRRFHRHSLTEGRCLAGVLRSWGERFKKAQSVHPCFPVEASSIDKCLFSRIQRNQPQGPPTQLGTLLENHADFSHMPDTVFLGHGR